MRADEDNYLFGIEGIGVILNSFFELAVSIVVDIAACYQTQRRNNSAKTPHLRIIE